MSLDALVSANIQKACAADCNALLRILEAGEVDEQFVHEYVARDPTGLHLVEVVNRFSLHLAFFKRKGGKPLATSSIMCYFG
jgi:hypothetical protein